MPTFIVKPNRDEDFYVFWSTVVDAPTAWGTRAEPPRAGCWTVKRESVRALCEALGGGRDPLPLLTFSPMDES